MTALDLALFGLGTAVLAWVSRRSLLRPLSHGFFRFFAWECILALILLNFPYWTVDPFSPPQIASWLLLIVSPILAVHAVQLLRRIGRPAQGRADDAELLAFEKTSTLVTTGVYRYIRHPMYAALIFLAWGAFLKHLSGASMALVSGATLALLLTALRDEAECRRHFGQAYVDYMKVSKRFVPYLW